MKVKDLKKALEQFTDEADIYIHNWTNIGSVFLGAELAVNSEFQKENNVVILRQNEIDRKLDLP